MRIDCDECVMQHTTTCDDCVDTFIIGRAPADAVVIDLEEQRAVRALQSVGLVPALRYRAREA